ncbi:MAG: histidine kinase dimerization/phosphoacceptor domain -containing protein [Flavobacteriales bacterium]
MAFRFADLPIRTKFLITLGIPVLGLVLLIGKQVDSSMKRTDVLGYVSLQARNIRVIGDVVDALQEEGAMTVATLEKVMPTDNYLSVARLKSDGFIARLNDPVLQIEARLRSEDVLQPLVRLRKRITGREISAKEAEETYRTMEIGLLANLGAVSKQAQDPETNTRLFAHQSLVNAKDALSDVRTRVLRGLADSSFTVADLGELNERIAQYETNSVLFRRDASPDVLEYYRSTFQGPEVNFMRSMVGTIHEKGGVSGLSTAPAEWWDLSGQAMGRLRQVEERSIDSIIVASEEVSHEAQWRLLLVLAALVGVVAAVLVMAVVLMRGLRNTVNEVTDAATSLAMGDARARVPVDSNDEVGQMARSFNVMIENIRALSANADAIGKGNYDTPVYVRGEQDVLGHSLTRMRDNLKEAKQRDMEHNQVLQAEKEKLEQANARIETLIKEIHHRVKNNLQVVASLLRLQSGTIEDESLLQVFAQSQSRVASMALIHEKLYKGDDLAQVDLSNYIKELFTELIQLNKVRENIRYRTAIDPDLVLDLDTMVPLGLILNELITNSFKHAFKNGREGFIDLRIHRSDGKHFDLHYADNGGGITPERANAETGTLGRGLIDSLVEQLNGFVTMESDSTGTRYHVRFGE